VTALLGASSAGQRGIQELEGQAAGLLSGKEAEPAVFPHRLAFNLIPQVGGHSADSPWMGEEEAVREESLRLWAGQAQVPEVAATLVQVPTFYGHALSLAVKLGRPASADEVRDAFKGATSVKVLDVPGEKVYPMPMLVTADPTVHVGRIRAVPGEPDCVLLFAAIDNAGRGAALNLVEVGDALLGRGG
jgi:aspartate-semialdehyde dehydrogenase